MDHTGFNSDEEAAEFLAAVGGVPFCCDVVRPTQPVRLHISADGITREDAIAHAFRVLALIVTSPKSKVCDTSCQSGNATAEFRSSRTTGR